jgi:hypothetical protein
MCDPNTRLYQMLGFLELTHLSIEAEIAEHGETWPLADANAMVVDAISQIKGELNSRISGELDTITAIIVKGVAA